MKRWTIWNYTIRIHCLTHTQYISNV